MIKSVCVYCGSSPGHSPAYADAARALGLTLAREGVTIVYGGGNVGLMGSLADAALSAGGRVIGVIPDLLVRKEVAHTGLTELRVVDSMHERKRIMFELADAFVALPGGMGTLEEITEILTWAQIAAHRKACAILNVNDYFGGLLAFFDTMVAQRFLRPEYRESIIVDVSIPALLRRIGEYVPTIVDKWMDRDAASQSPRTIPPDSRKNAAAS